MFEEELLYEHAVLIVPENLFTKEQIKDGEDKAKELIDLVKKNLNIID